MKKVKRNQLKIVIFTAVKKATYIAWACFRSGEARVDFSAIEYSYFVVFCSKGLLFPFDAYNRLRYFIVAFPGPSL